VQILNEDIAAAVVYVVTKQITEKLQIRQKEKI
jgi:hypothetical protein